MRIMMRSLIRKCVPVVRFPLMFVARNLWCGKKVHPFTVARFGAFVVGPLSRKYLCAVDDLYADLNGGKRLGRQEMFVLTLLGSRYCLLVRDIERDEVVGAAFYYFNARDLKDGTVHEGFIGLREAVRNAGLGMFIRRHALENFALSGLSGVSSRVSVNNLPSLKGNEKLGFVPVETYFDASMGEERHYLICDFHKNHRLSGETKRTFHQ